MREADRNECAAFGKSPKQALRWSLRTSLHAMTALDDGGRVLAMMGVSTTDLLNGIGSPWFLGTDDVFRYGKDLLSRGPGIIAGWHETFPLMENLVSTDNHRAIRMLKAWGACVGGKAAIHGGVEFVPFRFAIQAEAESA
jgi:hypothetical protein